MTVDVSLVPLDQLDLITATHYGTHGYPHAAWTRLRREDPVHWSQPAGYAPFWAVTKHADVIEVSTRPEQFRSFGRYILFPDAALGGPTLEESSPIRMLVNMDPPEHRDYRRTVSGWFTPRAVARLTSRLEVLTREIFDQLAKDGGTYECDFVRDVAALQPLRMITEILGIPRADEDFVLRITNENFGVEDPEFQRAGATQEEKLGFLQEAFAFLERITTDRRAHPRDDLSTVLATATLPDGAPVPQFELFSLYFLIMVAGHDTTRNAISSGMLALLEHPEELAAPPSRSVPDRDRRRRNPALDVAGDPLRPHRHRRLHAPRQADPRR